MATWLVLLKLELGGPSRMRIAMADVPIRPCLADSVLRPLSNGTLRRDGFRRRDVPHLGHGDGDAKGESGAHGVAVKPQPRLTLSQWTLSGHKGWVLCVEWDAREKILATGGHDGQVGKFFCSLTGSVLMSRVPGPPVVPFHRPAARRPPPRSHQVDHVARIRAAPPHVLPRWLATPRHVVQGRYRPDMEHRDEEARFRPHRPCGERECREVGRGECDLHGEQ